MQAQPPQSRHRRDDDNNHNEKQQERERQRRYQSGVTWTAASLALWLLATSLAMPYAQDKRRALRCDAACQGSLDAARSATTLVGATVVGRLSDCRPGGLGRRLGLLSGLAATAVALVATMRADTVARLWHAQVWPTLLQQNASLTRAAVADYQTALLLLLPVGQQQQVPSVTTAPRRRRRHATTIAAERSRTAGLLGAVGGLSKMLGPLLGSWWLRDMRQATAAALVCLTAAAACVAQMPTVDLPMAADRKQNDKDDGDDTVSIATATTTTSSSSSSSLSSWTSLLRSMLDVPAARSPPALFLLSCRLLSTLSFHIFSTVSVPSLQQRFQFGPADYGQYFSFIGFFYAASQYLAKYVLQYATAMTTTTNSSSPTTPLILSHRRKYVFGIAVALVGVGRALALQTTSLWRLYLYYAVVVLATGMLSTLFAADTSAVAPTDQAGAFFGLVATVEAGAGMMGPLIGGSLAQSSPSPSSTTMTTATVPLAPLMASSGLTALVLALVWFGYEPLVLQRISSTTMTSSSPRPSSSVSSTLTETTEGVINKNKDKEKTD